MGSLPNGTHFDPDNAMSSFDIFADFPYVDEAMFAQNQQTAAPVSQELSFPTSFTDEAFDAGNLDMLNTPFPQASEMSSFGAMDANFFCNTSASSYTPQQNLVSYTTRYIDTRVLTGIGHEPVYAKRFVERPTISPFHQ